jgi:MerR family transcriptional regulator, light-induced transcriptional regulator
MQKDPSEPQFPVRVVVRRTGLNPSLLRAWERRYSAVLPQRTEGGQRLYSEEQVQRLVLLKDAVEAGHSIGLIADLSDASLVDLAGAGSPSDLVPVRETGQASAVQGEPFLSDALVAVEEMQTRALEAILHRAAMALSPESLVDQVLVPLLREVGIQWRHGSITPAAEHIASGVLRRFLDWLVVSLESHAPKGLVLVGTPRGQYHEFGSLLAAVVCAAGGWRVLSLGVDLPAGEILLAVQKTEADVIALSAIYPHDERGLVDEMRLLRGGTPPSVRVLVGGPVAVAVRGALEEIGVGVLGDLEDLRRLLGRLSK